ARSAVPPSASDPAAGHSHPAAGLQVESQASRLGQEMNLLSPEPAPAAASSALPPETCRRARGNRFPAESGNQPVQEVARRTPRQKQPTGCSGTLPTSALLERISSLNRYRVEHALHPEWAQFLRS